jgi:hypothetical protein
MLSVGFGLRDSVHSRVHHYKQPGELAYFLPLTLRAAPGRTRARRTPSPSFESFRTPREVTELAMAPFP